VNFGRGAAFNLPGGEEFAAWLLTANYRPTTVGASVRELVRIREAHAAQEPVPEYCLATARRTLTWLQSTQQDEPLRRFLVEEGIQPVANALRDKPRQRVLEARSFDEEDWDRFRDALDASDDPRDRVIEVLCLTGLRVGDLLRTPTGSIMRGLELGEIQIERKGGTYVTVPVGVAEPWRRLLDQLLDARVPTVAALLSPAHPSPAANGAPYRQLDRRLKYWKDELGFTARIHTHKMRRTFAVRLYDQTKDLLAVQQGLNNGAQATMKYLDESRTNTIAEHQRALHQRRAT
jgi:site-specific recombinase XerC